MSHLKKKIVSVDERLRDTSEVKSFEERFCHWIQRLADSKRVCVIAGHNFAYILIMYDVDENESPSS